ncbi:hypothetical protein N7540_007825 [Penicillium herquei]|nr:hypothetical protein N7540_007825 [Penicillium herquei]
MSDSGRSEVLLILEASVAEIGELGTNIVTAAIEAEVQHVGLVVKQEGRAVRKGERQIGPSNGVVELSIVALGDPLLGGWDIGAVALARKVREFPSLVMPTGAPVSLLLVTGTSQRLTFRPAAESLVNLKNFWASVNSPGRLEMNRLSREKRMASGFNIGVKVVGGNSRSGAAEKVGVENSAFRGGLVSDVDVSAVDRISSVGVLSDGVDGNTLDVVGINEVGVAIAVGVPEAHLEAGNEVCDHRQGGSIVTAGLGFSLVAAPPVRGGRVVIQPGHLVNQITVAHALADAVKSRLSAWDGPQIDVELAVSDDGLDALEGAPLLKVLIVLGGGDIGGVSAHIKHNSAEQRAVDLVARVCGATCSKASGG